MIFSILLVTGQLLIASPLPVKALSRALSSKRHHPSLTGSFTVKKLLIPLFALTMLPLSCADARPRTLGDFFAGRNPDTPAIPPSQQDKRTLADLLSGRNAPKTKPFPTARDGNILPSRPNGCLADAAAGVVAGGSMRSRHPILGAGVGCAYGSYQRHQWQKQLNAYDSQTPPTH